MRRGSCPSTTHGLAPSDLDEHLDFQGIDGNFWVGLAILHSLFMREHNAICDRLAAEYPRMTDQQLYDTARLVNAALMAKIHTVDWTPAIIAHPTTVFGLRGNWFGLLGEGSPALRTHHQQCVSARHPRIAHQLPRRALLADRGVRGRLPDAPADSR